MMSWKHNLRATFLSGDMMAIIKVLGFCRDSILLKQGITLRRFRVSIEEDRWIENDTDHREFFEVARQYKVWKSETFGDLWEFKQISCIFGLPPDVKTPLCTFGLVPLDRERGL